MCLNMSFCIARRLRCSKKRCRLQYKTLYRKKGPTGNKEVYRNTTTFIARSVKEKILALRGKCIAIHRTVSQDRPIEKKEATRCDTTKHIARQL